MAYTAADPIALAKTVKDFAVQNKVLAVKGGVVEGSYFAGRAVRRDHQAGSRGRELLGKVGCLMASPLAKLLQDFASPPGPDGASC